jgi:hypothetical protein
LLIYKKEDHFQWLLKVIKSKIKSLYKRFVIRIYIIIIILGIVSGLSLIIGAYANEYGYTKRLNRTELKRLFYTPINYINGLFANPEKIIIDIKFKDYQKLTFLRDQALNKGVLKRSDDDYVPATIQYDKKFIDAKVRLKGDLLDHLEDGKWSFRIKIKGKDNLWGMKIFSIQKPKTRNYIYEWIVMKAYEFENLIALRYKFIDVTLNGKNIGIYAVEENFEKRLIENNHRKEGPIIKFNEEYFWDEFAIYNTNKTQNSGYGEYASADIESFRMNKIEADTMQYQLYLKAKTMLDLFRTGKLPTTSVFDGKQLAKFFAIRDVFNVWHGYAWTNVRFYFNPVTSLLEPIAFDEYPAHNLISPLVGVVSQDEYTQNIFRNTPKVMIEMFFKDLAFFDMYLTELKRLSQPKFLDSLYSTLNDEIVQNLKIIHNEHPTFSFDKNYPYRKQNYIRTLLEPKKGVNAYVESETDSVITINVGNVIALPVKIYGVVQNNNLITEIDPIILKSKKPMELVSYDNYAFDYLVPTPLKNENVSLSNNYKLQYSILGTDHILYEDISPHNYIYNDISNSILFKKNTLIDSSDIYILNVKTKEIIFKSKRCIVNEDIVIPAGYIVLASEGTIIDLVNSSKIISYSPFKFYGSDENPIRVFSSDSTGQGIAIMQTEEETIFQNVHFENLSMPREKNWSLSSSITFYESPVTIINCVFNNNTIADDFVNIIRSNFSIYKSIFIDTYADAIDCDFSKGEITDVNFKRIGNDALDISGSIVKANDLLMDSIGDKGVSVGEMSTLTAIGLNIINAEIAVASKDRSNIKINNIIIQDSKIGYTAYQKKPEFGPGTIQIENSIFLNVENQYYLEYNSTIIENGISIKPNEENIKELLY